MGFEKRKHGAELRARLKQLAARFGQAEIARRTDSAPANVHRYLREGKVPTEFCAALVSEFQVSPMWLIEGRGGMLRSEVREPIAGMGADLLELVETMNAVSRMRIGAVAGQHDRKTLRELSDSMEAFDRLREKLNVQTRTLLRGVLEEFGEALDRMDMDRAGSLRLTAQQLSRLTTDEELLDILDAREGGYAYYLRDMEKAVEFDRRVLARRLLDGRIRTQEGLVMARNLAMSMRDTGRVSEARRIARACISLAGGELDDLPVMSQLGLLDAHFDAELGDVRTALEKAARYYAPQRDDHQFAGIVYTAMHYQAGMWSFEQTLDFGEITTGKARLMIRYEVHTENADHLELCLRRVIGEPPDAVPANEYDPALAQLVLDLLKGRKRGVADFDKIVGASPPNIQSKHLLQVMLHLHRGMIARLVGDNTVLKKESAECEKAWQALPNELMAKMEWLLPRRRNLESIPPRQRTKLHREALARTQAEIESYIKRGYHFLIEP